MYNETNTMSVEQRTAAANKLKALLLSKKCRVGNPYLEALSRGELAPPSSDNEEEEKPKSSSVSRNRRRDHDPSRPRGACKGYHETGFKHAAPPSEE